jgi:hypothetical protein
MKFRFNQNFAFQIQKGWDVFDIYYNRTDVTFLYIAALIFYPTRRTKYIKIN